MTRHDPRVALEQIREHAREALDLVSASSRESLGQDRLRTLALVRLLEIVGEAANRVPEELRHQLPHIPWREMVGLRNRLIHAYDDVDLEIVWNTVNQDLPPLLRELERFLKEIPASNGMHRWR